MLACLGLPEWLNRNSSVIYDILLSLCIIATCFNSISDICLFFVRDIRLSAFECDLQRVDSRTGWWPILWRHETRRYAADMQWTTMPCHVSLFFTQLDHSAKSFILSSHWIIYAFHLAWRRGYVYVKPFGLYNVAVSNISCSHHILSADDIFNNLQTVWMIIIACLVFLNNILFWKIKLWNVSLDSFS